MNEDFVSFDLAKKLKEKGFREPCGYVYNYKRKELECQKVSAMWNHSEYWFAAPTISQVLKWLREEKKMHVMMATYSHYPNNTHDWGYEIINLQTYTCELYRCRFDSYEAAAIAGIEYALDNVI